MWRIIRTSILLIFLAVVVQQAFLDEADLDWKNNFYVAVYPINADASEQVAGYIKTLKKSDFEPIESFFAEEAVRYGVNLRRPVAVQLSTEVDAVPPSPPSSGGSMVQAMIWSLKFRWYAWSNSPKVAVKPDIKLYLLFYDPKTHNTLSHSTALNKGRIGRINLFGDRAYAKKNLVVTAHELLHTLTATDKYDLSTGLPIYPDGYAEPEKSPRYPQYFAELMGGYVPISESQKKIPMSLKQTLIGLKTAREIGWLK